MAATRISLGQRRHSGGDTRWMHHAVCRDEDPELFFPTGNGDVAQRQAAEALAVCARCPVVAECRSWALETGQEYGAWGGYTEDGFQELRRAQRRVRTGAGS